MKPIDSYKGVRDFYPEDQRIQNYIFAAMRRAVERFGYEEMNASILEATELYATKTSEEIVNQQTYTFTDRGGRSVTLRPEMTPTVARMVAAKKRELGYPLRLYSIQNFFRYERPQRGRLREFWQLNADLFGVSGIEADAEAIVLASQIMKELGAKESDYEIHVNNRTIIIALYKQLAKEEGVELSDTQIQKISRLNDKRGKITPEKLDDEFIEIVGKGAFEKLKNAFIKERIESTVETLPEYQEFGELSGLVKKLGVHNTKYDGELVRGFDYYTGVIFEVFDTNPENSRSMFGGGRYDNLISQYGGEATPAVGFAMGDVIARDFLETHNLLPALQPSAKLYLAPMTQGDTVAVAELADALRGAGVHVALGMKHKNRSDHLKAALKLGIPYFVSYGEKEKNENAVTLKEFATEKEELVGIDKLASRLLP